MLTRNNHDDAPEKEPYWSVTRIPGTVTGVRIFYALSYYKDAGDPVFHMTSHDGDSEFIIIDLQNDMNPYYYTLWELNQATLSAHWMAGTNVDHSATYAAGFLEYPSVYRGRPRIWVSFDKHANYRNKSVCDGEWNDVVAQHLDSSLAQRNAFVRIYARPTANTVGTRTSDHFGLWGPIIGGAVGGVVGYLYERGHCDQLAALCTGRHGAIGGAILGAAVGYGIQRLFRQDDSATVTAGAG